MLSLRTAASSTGIAAGLGEDIIGDVTFSLLKLRIHAFEALSAEGTPIKNGESIEALSRDAIDKNSIGEKVQVEMELRGDTGRHRWLVTKITSASPSDPARKD